MKRKIIYTLSFIFCMSLYASSKEYARKERSEKKAIFLLVKEQDAEEIAAELPLAHILCHIS
jgi:hypothetical protein